MALVRLVLLFEEGINGNLKPIIGSSFFKQIKCIIIYVCMYGCVGSLLLRSGPV